MTTTTALLILVMLTMKHFIVDFTLQPAWMWQNKGIYGHPGGIAHSGLHAVVTIFILVWMFFVSWPVAFALGFLEFIIHYHMDWFKMWYNKRQGWGPTTHSQWFVLLGLDQFVHSMTYILLVCLLV